MLPGGLEETGRRSHRRARAAAAQPAAKDMKCGIAVILFSQLLSNTNTTS